MAIRKIYRPREVDQIFGWSPSTRKRKIRSGELRKPIPLGPQMVGFPEEYLEEYREWLLKQGEQEEAHAT